MTSAEQRHLITTRLLQATAPQTAAGLARDTRLPLDDAQQTLHGLIQEGLVVSVEPTADASPRFRWAARVREEASVRARLPQEALAERMAAFERVAGAADVDIDISAPAATAFHDFVVGTYEPPADKRWLVLVQCSVRRPFSSSPSHAAIRRAVATATGSDTDMARCPVHMVVLASRIGPVPYDLQQFYPACVRSDGVQQFDQSLYDQFRPVLVRRMAEYLSVHGGRYEHTTAFGQGRYGQILRDASMQSAIEFAVLPDAAGPQLTRVGRSTPRKYWDRYWIQLYQLLRGWLSPEERLIADERLAALDVEIAT